MRFMISLFASLIVLYSTGSLSVLEDLYAHLEQLPHVLELAERSARGAL